MILIAMNLNDIIMTANIVLILHITSYTELLKVNHKFIYYQIQNNNPIFLKILIFKIELLDNFF